MIFYHTKSVEQMLDNTHDPIGDFINACSADVVNFASHNTFEDFADRTQALNDLATFPMLTDRAAGIGYQIDKVVFRGYEASAQLQSMHNQAIQSRTQLQLQSRAAEQSQSMEDVKLEHDEVRASKVQQLAAGKVQHEVQIDQMQHAEKMRQIEAEHAQELAYLRSLAKEGLDITAYLVAKEDKGGPGREMVAMLRGAGIRAGSGGGTGGKARF